MDGAVLEVQKRAPCGAGQGMHHPGWQTCSQGAVVMLLTLAELQENARRDCGSSSMSKLCSSIKPLCFLARHHRCVCFA